MKLKAAILILFFLICNYFSYSQIYNPFPEKYGKWIINRDGPNGPGEIEKWNLTLYETGGDTIVAGLKYKKIMVTAELSVYPSSKSIWSHDFGSRQLAFAYRNDITNKKVYILTDSNEVINGKLTKEYVWYNFNLKINDTITEYTYALNVHGQFARRKVKSIDSIFICGRYERIFSFDCKAWDRRLIEGVGFKDHFIKTDPTCGSVDPPYLYKTEFSCSPTSISRETESLPAIFISPNPASDRLQVRWFYTKQSEWFIVDCQGKFMLQKNDESEFIDISKLSAGMYFIILTDKQGHYYKDKFIKQE
jgi:hypothetical protein